MPDTENQSWTRPDMTEREFERFQRAVLGGSVRWFFYSLSERLRQHWRGTRKPSER